MNTLSLDTNPTASVWNSALAGTPSVGQQESTLNVVRATAGDTTTISSQGRALLAASRAAGASRGARTPNTGGASAPATLTGGSAGISAPSAPAALTGGAGGISVPEAPATLTGGSGGIAAPAETGNTSAAATPADANGAASAAGATRQPNRPAGTRAAATATGNQAAATATSNGRTETDLQQRVHELERQIQDLQTGGRSDPTARTELAARQVELVNVSAQLARMQVASGRFPIQ